MEQRQWKEIRKFEEILFEEYNGIAKITINRPRYRNAFTPKTTLELSQAFALCRELQRIRVVLLTGAMSDVPEGQRLEDVKHAFCSGGDMHVKGRGGYIDDEGVPRLSVLDVQMQIRRLPKPVIAMVNGYAIGGGHVLHLVCDLTIASENAIFGQTGPKVGSFDAGFGSSYLARIVGQKKAREIWFLCRQYSAQEALDMGMVNKVVPLAKLEDECVRWAEEMMLRSPIALRMIKAGLNAELDGQAGIQQLAGDATMLYYFLDEAQEGGKAFLEKRKPDFDKYPQIPLRQQLTSACSISSSRQERAAGCIPRVRYGWFICLMASMKVWANVPHCPNCLATTYRIMSKCCVASATRWNVRTRYPTKTCATIPPCSSDSRLLYRH